MKILFALLFFCNFSFAASVTLECKESSKKVRTECSKDNFSQAWTDAFSQVPFKYKLIFDDMEKCAKSVSLCYDSCGNKTLSQSDGISKVTGSLRKSYGKKPHTAEIINCRGYLSDYAKEVEGTCEAEMIKQKSQMSPKDKGLKELSSKCASFMNFETPELETEDEYGQNQQPQVDDSSKIEPFKAQISKVDVTTKLNAKINSANNSNTIGKINEQPGVDPLKRINQMNQGTPGGVSKNNSQGVGSHQAPVVVGQSLVSVKKKSNLKKKRRGAQKSPLKKISDQLAGEVYEGVDPKLEGRAKKFQIAKEKSELDQASKTSLTDNLSPGSGVISPKYEGGHNPGALGFSLFHKNTKAIDELRKSQMTLE